MTIQYIVVLMEDIFKDLLLKKLIAYLHVSFVKKLMSFFKS